jgi:hemolysin activation/secretion protein
LLSSIEFGLRKSGACRHAKAWITALVVVLAAAWLLSPGAFAQEATNGDSPGPQAAQRDTPANAEAHATGESPVAEEAPTTTETPITDQVPAAAEQAGGDTTAEAQPSAKKEVHFDINEIRVRGNTLLEKVAIELAMYRFLGTAKTIHDVEAARQALEQRYRDVGYPTVMVDIPEQDVQDGIVVLKVTEAKIEQFTVTGSDFFSIQRIKQSMPALTENTVLNMPAFQEQMAELSMRSPDRTIIPVLKPGRVPGTVDVELKVKDKAPLHASLEVNNRASSTTTSTRASALARYDNMWQREHSLSLQYQTSPEDTDEVRVFMTNYLAKIGAKNLLAAYWVNSDSDVATTSTITVIGRGSVLGVRGILPLPMLQNQMQNFMIGLDYKDFSDKTDIQGFNPESTPIQYYGLVMQYNINSQHFGPDQKLSGNTRFNISATFGVGALNEKQIDCGAVGGSRQEMDQFECKRFGAKPNYFYARGGLSHESQAAYGFRWYLSGEVQLADSPLISNEQFSMGGASTVRGYYESQRLGDSGYLLSVELRSASFGHMLSRHLDDLHYDIFWDFAHLRTIEALTGEEPSWELSGAGFGFRLVAFKSLKAQVDWAYALKDSDNADNGVEPDVKKGDGRFHASVSYEF